MQMPEKTKHSWTTYVGAADTFQQQSSDLCLPIELALGHPQLLLCLRNKGKQYELYMWVWK